MRTIHVLLTVVVFAVARDYGAEEIEILKTSIRREEPPVSSDVPTAVAHSRVEVLGCIRLR